MGVELPPRKVQKGRNDLGDVQLESSRVLLAGRVVRGDGAGDEQPAVEVHRSQGTWWSQAWDLHLEWPERDRFELRGVLADGTPLRLVVREGPWLPVAPLDCAVGAKDLELRLEVAASLTATFLVDERTPVALLLWRLLRVEPPEERDLHAAIMDRYRFLGQDTPKDGKLQRSWTGLTSGTYRLTVACPGIDEPVAQLDALRVDRGPCADPRLLAIDLRGRVRTLQVRATDADGRPVQDRAAFVVPVSRQKEWSGFHLGLGFVDLATTGPVDLLVVAPGHRVARYEAAVRDCTVELQRAAEARITVALPFPLPEGRSLSLRLEPVLEVPRGTGIQLDTGRGMGIENFLFESAPVGADGVATVPVRMPGRHQLRVVLDDRRYIYGLEPRTLELAADGGTATVRVLEKDLNEALSKSRR
jgi:hypothetical protein